MSLRDLLPLVWSNLNRMRGRVLMTILGVVVGTAAVVVLVSLGAGLQRQALRSLGSGATEIRITGDTTFSTGTSPARADARIFDDTLLARVESLPGVENVTPFEPVMAPLDVQAGRLCARSLQVRGIDPERFEQLGLRAASGSLTLERGQAVLGARIPESLARHLPQQERAAGPPELVGETLTLYLSRQGADGTYIEKIVRLEVVGVLAPHNSHYDFAIYIPEREALALNGWFLTQRRDPARQGYPEVVVKVADVRETAEVEAQLAALGLNPFSDREQAESLGAYFNELQRLLGGIAGVSLLVAAFSIANTMLMAIYERTREIGLMKALGATHRDVMLVFLTEAGAIGLLGGGLGVAVGLGVNGLINLLGGESPLVRQMFGAGTSLRAFTPLWLPPFAVGFAVLVGVLSGIYPAQRAARLTPLRALKLG